MMQIVLGWWLALITPDPQASADASATCRSLGLAKAEVEWSCGRALDVMCAERGFVRDREIAYGSRHCDEDDDGWATCTIVCSTVCSDPTEPGEDE